MTKLTDYHKREMVRLRRQELAQALVAAFSGAVAFFAFAALMITMVGIAVLA